MYYPKECFSINEQATRAAMREYDKKVETWYKAALALFPDYWKMDPRERIKIRKAIDEKVGFSV